MQMAQLNHHCPQRDSPPCLTITRICTTRTRSTLMTVTMAMASMKTAWTLTSLITATQTPLNPTTMDNMMTRNTTTMQTTEMEQSGKPSPRDLSTETSVAM